MEPALSVDPDSQNEGRGLAAREPLLVVIVGPTASEKTALSLALAERFRGEIVNCDSVAMYREFDIGTAKPSAAERARAPHHLLDFVEPARFMTAGEYARQARQVLAEIKLRQRLPIVVGGTGLYLRALLEGLSPARSARRSCASVCGKVRRDVDPNICTEFWCASTALRPRKFMPTTSLN